MRQTRNTPQRQLIRSVLEHDCLHPTADEVYELARRENPTISRGTVYRNLNLLAENAEIVRLSMPIGADHYDWRTQPHYHFLCRSCNRVLDTELLYNTRYDGMIPEVPGCKIEWHKLILVGLCPNCNQA